LIRAPRGVDAFDQVDAVEHGTRGAIPFGDDEAVAFAKLVDRFLELGSVLDALAGGLLAEDDVDAFGTKRAKLPVEVLVARADPAISDLSHLVSILK
jgi:hypothetical protein